MFPCFCLLFFLGFSFKVKVVRSAMVGGFYVNHV